MPSSAPFPSSFPRSFLGGTSRAVRFLDLVVVVWVAGWIVLGVVIGFEVRDLRQLSDTVVTAGSAVERSGRALRPLGNLPLVGGRIGQVEGQVEAAGRSAVRSGTESRGSIGRLSFLLALSIVVIPTVPMVAVYVPLRRTWTRDVRAVRRSLAASGGDPVFVEFLARRAVLHLPYHKLREVSDNPWRDVENGRHEALARAELARLGIRSGVMTTDSRSVA